MGNGYIVLCLLYVYCYLFIGAMEHLFPNIFNQQIEKIYNAFKYRKGKHAEEKPRDSRMFSHNNGSCDYESKPEAKIQNNKKKSKSVCAHDAPNRGKLFNRIIRRLFHRVNRKQTEQT